MSPSRDQQGITLDVWLGTLQPAEVSAMIGSIASKFTNHDEVQSRWMQYYSTKGYYALPKIVRDHIAHQYLLQHEAVTA